MRPLLWPTRHMLSEGGCTLRTGRHLLIIVSLILASISVTVRESGEGTGTVSTLSTECEGLNLHAGMHGVVYEKHAASGQTAKQDISADHPSVARPGCMLRDLRMLQLNNSHSRHVVLLEGNRRGADKGRR